MTTAPRRPVAPFPLAWLRDALLLLVLGLLPSMHARAQFGVGWQRSPSIVVIASSAADPRLEWVDVAIAYWNGQLQEVGSAFRMGKPERLIQTPPDTALQDQSRMVLDGAARAWNIPAVLKELPGDLRIVLGDVPFVSHAGPFDEQRRRTVGIRSANVPPLSLPNVAVNLIAHEIGHAIGMPHNADPTALMCGRPAPCRPDIYQSPTFQMFPLLADERAMLLRLYPVDWRPIGE